MSAALQSAAGNCRAASLTRRAMPVTSCPAASNRAVTAEPINPAAPVIKTRKELRALGCTNGLGAAPPHAALRRLLIAVLTAGAGERSKQALRPYLLRHLLAAFCAERQGDCLVREDDIGFQQCRGAAHPVAASVFFASRSYCGCGHKFDDGRARANSRMGSVRESCTVTARRMRGRVPISRTRRSAFVVSRTRSHSGW